MYTLKLAGGSKKLSIKVKDLTEACKETIAYVLEHKKRINGINFSSHLYKNKKLIGSTSYNGTVWVNNHVAVHPFKAFDHQINPPLQGNGESRHPCVGYRQYAILLFLKEERDYGSPAANHIAVSDDCKLGADIPAHGVSRNEQLVGTELGSSIEVDRVCGLVGA